MTFLADRLIHLSPTLVYSLVALFVFGEAALFVGFVLPGETAVVIGGFIASQGRINIVALCAIVVTAAIVGDTVGYAVGARYGTRLLEIRLLRSRRANIATALGGLERNGATYVFIGRFTAFFRAVVPGLAGMSDMRYPRFLAANAAGGLCWGIGYALLGYFLGNGYKKVAHYSTYGGIVLVVLVLTMGITLHVRRRRREKIEEAAFERAHPDGAPSPDDIEQPEIDH